MKNRTEYYIVSLVNSSVQSTVYIVIKLIKKFKIPTDCFTNPQQIVIFVFQIEINAVQVLQVHPRRESCSFGSKVALCRNC